MEKHGYTCTLPATIPGFRPADFPLGTLESRAAARMAAKTRPEAKQNTRELIVYCAHFDDEPLMIYDYDTGLLISEAEGDMSPQLQEQNRINVPAPPPALGESADDPPVSSHDHLGIITVEVG